MTAAEWPSPSPPPKVVVAPNPFKGTLDAAEAAEAIAEGTRRALPDATVELVPVADGGEGTVTALVAAARGFLASAVVEGPMGIPTEAVFGIIDGGRTAVVELAASSGLPLVPADRRDPRVSSTYGFGQLLEAARSRGVRRIIAGIGGSATNDAGAGMAQAIGVRLLDSSGADLPRGGAALARLDRLDRSGVDPGWSQIEVMVACDVDNPLCGPTGASAVYGPQKGADAAAVAELDGALGRFAEVVGGGIADLPGAGAAGGAGAGLVAFLGARLVRGAPLVVEAAGLDAHLPGASLVITGEGRADAQTAHGKGPVEVAHRARAAGVPCLLVAGSLGDGWQELAREGVTAVEAAEAGPVESSAARLADAAERGVRRLGIGT